MLKGNWSVGYCMSIPVDIKDIDRRLHDKSRLPSPLWKFAFPPTPCFFNNPDVSVGSLYIPLFSRYGIVGMLKSVCKANSTTTNFCMGTQVAFLFL